jgi:hypothetical protein
MVFITSGVCSVSSKVVVDILKTKGRKEGRYQEKPILAKDINNIVLSKLQKNATCQTKGVPEA